MYNKIGLDATHRTIAESVIDSFEQVIQKQSLLNTYDEIFLAYNHVIMMCGSYLEQLITTDILPKIITAKIEKHIYSLHSSKSDMQTINDTINRRYINIE